MGVKIWKIYAFLYKYVREICDNFTNRVIHFLVSSTKLRIHKFQFHTNRGD